MDTITTVEPVNEVPSDRGSPSDDLQKANGWVVVSWWQHKSGDGTKGQYEYEHFAGPAEALQVYQNYEEGEYARARPVGIFAVRNGMPTGQRINPSTGRPIDSSHLAKLLEDAAKAGLAGEHASPVDLTEMECLSDHQNNI